MKSAQRNLDLVHNLKTVVQKTVFWHEHCEVHQNEEICEVKGNYLEYRRFVHALGYHEYIYGSS